MNPKHFDTEFYPTPPHVAGKMIAFSGRSDSLDKLSILDPSAGAGALLEAVKNRVRYHDNLFAIEQHPEHIAMLQGKGFPVIGYDFLEWTPMVSIDLILMNPPFSTSADHLLHAWHVLREGTIVCLLNETSFETNATAKWEEVRDLVKAHGESQHLGRVFASSARPTLVEIVMVKLTKVAKTTFEFEAPTGKGQSTTLGDDFMGQSLPAKRDVLGNMEHYHNITQQAALDMVDAMKRLNYAASALLGNDLNKYGDARETAWSWISKLFERGVYHHSWSHRHNIVAQQITQSAWMRVVEETGFQRHFTTKVREEFDAFVKKQSILPFTVENVLQMLGQVVENRDKIMEDAMSAVFDKLTSYDSKNKASEDLHRKHWKTNRGHMLAKKIIVPHVVSRDGSTYRSYGGNIAVIDDLDKVLAWLTGKTLDPLYNPSWKEGDPEVLSVEGALLKARNQRTGGFFLHEHESEFFRIRAFKKGTVHLTFRDPKVWQDFNIAAAKAKRWLGAESSGK